MRAAVAVLLILGVAAWVVGFVAMFGAETTAARSIDAAHLFAGVVALTLLSFLIWPGRA